MYLLVRKIGPLFCLVSLLFLSACNSNVLVDTNTTIPGRNWSYINKVKVDFEVKDTNKPYNVYLNLRHTADYKYSNVYVLIHQVGPDGKRISTRHQFMLAHPDGEWTGSGSGNLYTHQPVFMEKYKFPAPGKYHFEIEQNMRDNPLKEISDVGLKVEASE